VARHLVAAGRFVDDDPETALAHAVAARRLASRIAAVREAVGIAAYHAGEWQTAAAELRTYHRMTGRQTHLAVLADCERALGRPEKAIDIYRSADPSQLDRPDAVELLIVAAGARRDMGQDEAAVAMLQVRELAVEGPWSARLRYAFADGLLAVGREEEAREWFARALEADDEGQTDAAERLLELDGVTLDDTGDEGDGVEHYADEGHGVEDEDEDVEGEDVEGEDVEGEDVEGDFEDVDDEDDLDDADDFDDEDDDDDDDDDDDEGDFEDEGDEGGFRGEDDGGVGDADGGVDGGERDEVSGVGDGEVGDREVGDGEGGDGEVGDGEATGGESGSEPGGVGGAVIEPGVVDERERGATE
jgi:tetratricopeptide (TPR) repeat protein